MGKFGAPQERAAPARGTGPPLLRASGNSPLPPAGKPQKGGIGDGGDRILLMQAIRSLSSQRGAFTQQLLNSRLGISGLLEAVFGELTSWRSEPSIADLRAWRRWDRTYELLARRAGVLKGPWERLMALEDACCQFPAGVSAAMAAGGNAVALVERADFRPQSCAALCSPLRTA